MISDWTIYGYVGDGGVICRPCVRDDDSGRYLEAGSGVVGDGNVYDTVAECRLDGLLSIADTDPLGLSCDACGGWVFEPDPAAWHAEHGHAEPADDCELCAAVATQLEDWAAEHEAGEHRDAPILHPVNVRGGWAESVTPAGCPDCEREHEPAPGQLELRVSGADDAHPVNAAALGPLSCAHGADPARCWRLECIEARNNE